MDEKTIMKDYMVTKLAMLLIENKEVSTMTQALNLVINSDTYQRVLNDHTALYFQSPRYVYEFLNNELHLGKVG